MVTNFNILRSRLESERKRLIAELEQSRSDAHQPSERKEGSPFGKREEDATETQELEKRLTLEKRTLDQIAAVERALAKFDKGTYGRCEHCGKPIDAARLEALPHAALCLKCKAALAPGGKPK